MKKRIFLFAVAAVIVMLSVGSTIGYCSDIIETADVYIDGEQVIFPDMVPIITNGRTMVPMRAIFEKLGAAIFWDGETETVIATRGGTTVVVQIDNNVMIKNDEKIELDVPAALINSRTLVPVRAISEAFGCDVKWNEAAKSVIITTSK